MGTCPDIPIPPPSCGGGPCQDAMPFDAATGAVEQSFSFLQTEHGSVDLTWYNLYETADAARGLGSNWSAYQFAEVIVDDVNATIAVMFAPGRAGCGGGPGGGGPGGGGGGPGDGGGGCNGGSGTGVQASNTYWCSFDSGFATTTYTPCFGCLAAMTQEVVPAVLGAPDDWRLVEPDGTVTIFDGTDKLIKTQTTPGGQVTEFLRSTTTSVPRIEEMRRTFEYGTNQETIESRLFEYDGDNVQYITLRRATDSSSPSWTNIRRVELVYYTTNQVGKGNIGDLKLIKQQLPGTSPGTWVDDKIQLFRYYTNLETNGFQHGLKYVLSPEGYERMSDPEGSSNAQLAPFASAFYEYGSDRKVTTVSTEGGQVTNTIVWDEKDPMEFDPDGYNNWLRKAVITMPDGLEKTVYSNRIGQDLLVDDKDGSDHWITNWKYNTEGRLEQMVHPAAIDMSGTPYNDSSDNLAVQVKSNAGLIDVFTYHTSGAAGYPEFRKVKKGSSGDEILISETDYVGISIGTEPITSIFLIDEMTQYRSDSGTGDPVITSIEYTWFADTVQVQTATTHLPAVPTAENGFNVVDTIVREFDIQGRVIKITDPRGTITIYEYDEVTGSPIQMVQDAGVGGLLLTTDYDNDDLGRQTQSLGPTFGSGGESVRSATWTVYQDEDDEVWIGQGYKTGSSYTLINPVTIQKQDKNGRVVDSIRATRGSGVENSGALTASDSFLQSSWVAWTVTMERIPKSPTPNTVSDGCGNWLPKTQPPATKPPSTLTTFKTVVRRLPPKIC